MADSPDDTSGSELNIDDGVSQIADGLFDSPADGQDEVIDTSGESEEVTAVDEPTADDPAPEAKPEVVAKPPPQSWAKDKHAIWSTLTPDAQDYYMLREKQMLDGLEQYKEHSAFGKQLRDVFTPYRALLQAQGVDEAKATQYMLNAHYRLSSGTPQERATYFSSLAKSYGIDLAGLAPSQEQQIDPTVKALQDEVGSLKQTVAQRQQQEFAAAQNKVKADVDAFAADPKNVYFDECAEDIVALVQAGNTLEQAYEKAVYANPVTRAKELARIQTEHEKSLREKAKAEAEAARKASSTNVRTRDTRKAPTEPKGTMDDTLRATLKDIKERVH